VEWGIEADAQRLLLAAAAAGDREATGGGGGLPLEEDEAATLRACGLTDGTELLLTLQEATQGAARRELRETASMEVAERAELSALRGAARNARRGELKRRSIAELSKPQREFLSREAQEECLCWSRAFVLVLASCGLVLLLLYATVMSRVWRL
jgi:hypothetical protein